MKKEEYKYRFIELRALGYSYLKICKELNISKPTAIKWGKLLSSEINRQQKYLMSNLFSQRIVEQEQGLLVKLEQFRRKKDMNLPKRISDKIDKKILNVLEKIFLKKITAIHIKVKDDNVISATFIFNDDVVLETRKSPN
ncbi:MAG: hypothetical protein A3K31_14180 [Ignavibacteria bacterium RIFOXYA12_FULL_35_25]|nr:MAG: hypothetical protein A2006_13635 [Ignavibacteria bacterium GWC2_35_8]OGU56970.1 MAG: hypothetical protein A2X60_11200 [Ignavibacteria bacterium GWF2_35_20]OGU80940.1 MAG: hypothetical protein A2254_02480 [Ignavibacteria bacterium RIFOXYA2_FULL_35_9]OGU87883.1 MAG: hypothetical protein A3K31_14180 [Ignavibacteria bacterium RIFOXYA12_FULL_35_25]OGV28747.1 MAG: hypothetical protein A2523_09950 [Ignavibacteria bacterium RIFOXYD12_FULL_36_8]